MVTRRHALKLGGSALALTSTLAFAGCARTRQTMHRWDGEALGAPGFITLYGLGQRGADEAFVLAQKTIKRLEHSFSLYRPNSEISRLNCAGHLKNASPALLELVTIAKRISVLSEGAFDISVQVLWETAKKLQSLDPTPSQRRQIWAAVYALVNYNDIHIEGSRIWFGRPGMKITLNGIAQGYISEQIAKELGQKNHHSGLVNIGEFQAFGQRSFNVTIQDPGNILDTIAAVSLQDAGLATSAASGGFLGDGRSHIFEPRTLDGHAQFASASVVHSSAAIADGLATAFTLMDETAIRKAAKNAATEQVILARAGGEIIQF